MKVLLVAILAVTVSAPAFAWPWSAEEIGWIDIEMHCNRGLYDAEYYIGNGGVKGKSVEIKRDTAAINTKLNDLVKACEAWSKNSNCNTCKDLDILKRELNAAATDFDNYRIKLSHFEGEMGVFGDFVRKLGMKDCMKAIGNPKVKNSKTDIAYWKARNIRVFNAAFAKCGNFK